MTKETGTGHGLPKVKKLTKLQDGELRLESEINVETVVTVTLPAERVWKTRDQGPALH